LQLWRLRWLTPFLQNNFGRETLFIYIQALALKLYGISILSLKLPAAMIGILTVPLVYVVARRLQLDCLSQKGDLSPTRNPKVDLTAHPCCSAWSGSFGGGGPRLRLNEGNGAGLGWPGCC
jgi:hypothetical protein